jgi:hypothetical protein
VIEVAESLASDLDLVQARRLHVVAKSDGLPGGCLAA